MEWSMIPACTSLVIVCLFLIFNFLTGAIFKELALSKYVYCLCMYDLCFVWGLVLWF